jgi:hypothetical protein
MTETNYLNPDVEVIAEIYYKPSTRNILTSGLNIPNRTTKGSHREQCGKDSTAALSQGSVAV